MDNSQPTFPKRHINHVAVLGSGIMGSRIAALFASVGVKVLLLDLVPKELNDQEKAKGISNDSQHFRNRIVQEAWSATLKAKPAALYEASAATHITLGNFTDDMHRIAEADWIIEVVIENLEIKKQVYEQVEKYRKPGTLITSNTSGIPIHLMAEGRSEDFQQNFCGTHFFNPPRYLRLLEVIPTKHTKPEVIQFLMDYGSKFLGKTTVQAKDTPTFIANRVGVFSFMAIFHVMQELGLNVDEVDQLTGPAMGRPKSATFRTGDVVGLDTLVQVAKGLSAHVPKDEMRNLFTLPSFLEEMVQRKWLGDKTGQGFYKKSKDASGKTEILTLDLKDLEYKPKQKTKFATLDAAKQVDDLQKRLRTLYKGSDKAGDFYRRFHHLLFAYVSYRLPEIADELYKIDDALKAGFGWELGPFESWDALGVKKVLESLQQENKAVAPWVLEMVEAGFSSFYKTEKGKRLYYNIASKSYQLIPGQDSFILLENLSDNVVWNNSACQVIDMGDDVLAMRWNTKMNSIGGEVLEGLHQAVQLAEENFKGLVLANGGPNFSAGANVGLIFMFAAEQEYDELDMAVRAFQNATMRLRYSNIPVVAAPHGLTLGGGCEICLHTDAVQAAAESYIGLVELGVGLIPGGGGSKEMALRASDRNIKEDIELNFLQQIFINIGMAKVSTSAHEAYDLHYLQPYKDAVSINPDRRIADAQRKVISLYERGYTRPQPRQDIKVQGRAALGPLVAGLHAMRLGNYISDYDKKVAEKLAHVMCGGDLSLPTIVNEQYLLDLEREAFLSLCGERKTLERLQSILQTGKPLRN